MNYDGTFESAMSELDEIVKQLELGTLSLDESLARYERAVALVRFATEKLEDAKQRVRILNETADGTVSDAPFDVDNAD